MTFLSVNKKFIMKIIHVLITSILLYGAITFAATHVYSADMAERFQPRIYNSKKYSSLPYRLLIPKYYDRSRQYPLVLFLHGSDERGSDNRRQLFVGLHIFADEKRMDQYPCFIAAPQCPLEMKWVDVDWKADTHMMPRDPTPAMAMSLELIEELQKEFSIDRNRLYVVGYSMGGYAVWDAIQRWPNLFAAAVPVCGGGDETKAPRIAQIPIWAFHGARDQIVKVPRSRNMINAIVIAGGTPRYTEYPTINHFSWGYVFGDTEMFHWLFDQKKQ